MESVEVEEHGLKSETKVQALTDLLTVSKQVTE
jgi:hypothetical protein